MIALLVLSIMLLLYLFYVLINPEEF
ncbi:MAG: K(+)-transporting ATPase subunit F [Ignavibacteria bacterium]|nr:K(+)-transporting ATPase subunit F [Ignavibacteria bacterium]